MAWNSPARRAFSFLLNFCALSPVVATLTSPRVFGDVPATPNESGVAHLVGRFASPAALLLATAVVLLALPLPGIPVGKRRATIFAVALYSTPLVISPFALHGRINFGEAAAVMIMAAVATVPEINREALLRRFLWLARIVLSASLVAAIVARNIAWERDYAVGFLPWHGRLHGVLPHANSVGAIAVTALVVVLSRRGNTTYARFDFVIASTALLLSQSKGSIAAGGLVLAISIVSRRGARRGTDVRRRWLAGGVLVLALSFGFAVGPFSRSTSVAESSASAETFTGRTSVWAATVREWRLNPVFGYGTGLWGPEMQRRYESRLHFRPGQAHNQVVQTLGESGLVGLVVLVLFLVQFTRRCVSSGDTLAIGFALLLVARSTVESPLDPGILGINLWLVVLMLTYVDSVARERQRQSLVAEARARTI
jgi:O-antigen ligase